jgi:ribosomal protein S18 acetylase RimI-like enzyme
VIVPLLHRPASPRRLPNLLTQWRHRTRNGSADPLVYHWAEESEWEAIRTIRLAMLEESPSAFLDQGEHTWTESHWKRCFKESDWLLATDKDTPTPVATARTRRLSEEVLYVESVWVDPNFRGRGVARHLLTEIKEKALEDGASCVRLAVLDSNRGAARQVFRALSFTEICRRDGAAEQDLECLVSRAKLKAENGRDAPAASRQSRRPHTIASSVRRGLGNLTGERALRNRSAAAG